jgi:hypothetical protein
MKDNKRALPSLLTAQRHLNGNQETLNFPPLFFPSGVPLVPCPPPSPVPKRGPTRHRTDGKQHSMRQRKEPWKNISWRGRRKSDTAKQMHISSSTSTSQGINPVRTSQETHYVSATEPSRLMLCKICGFHGGDYEECCLLRYNNPVRTSQETH